MVPSQHLEVYQGPLFFYLPPSHMSRLNYLFSFSDSQPTFLDFIGITVGKAAQNSELTFLGLPALELSPIILCTLVAL